MNSLLAIVIGGTVGGITGAVVAVKWVIPWSVLKFDWYRDGRFPWEKKGCDEQ